MLGLTPPVERRDVKRAYARLLKQNRPDDDPGAFEQLHGAYQTALWYVENGIAPQAVESESPTSTTQEDASTADAFDDADDSQHADLDVHGSNNIDQSDSAVLAQQAAEEAVFAEQEAARVAHVDEMMREVYALLANEQRLNNPEAWRPLADDPALIDDRLRILFGAELGAAIADHQREAWKNKADRYSRIPVSVASLLDSAVLWTLRPEDYYNDLSYDDWTVLENLAGEEERRELPEAMGGEVQEEITEWAKASRIKDGAGWSGPSKFLLLLVIVGVLRLCSMQSGGNNATLDSADTAFTQALVGTLWRTGNRATFWETMFRGGRKAVPDRLLSSVSLESEEQAKVISVAERFLAERLMALATVRNDAEMVSAAFATRSDRALRQWLLSPDADQTLRTLEQLTLAHQLLPESYRKAIPQVAVSLTAAKVDSMLRRKITAMLRSFGHT